MEYPAIAIYAGKGSSHSWLWFADLFERFGMVDLSFFGEEDLKAGKLESVDVLALSGGDTFALAEGLGAGGASRIDDWVRQGGLYLGSCAGAYLPLHSSQKPLDLFNFVEARISNLTSVLPEPRKFKERFSLPYGCSFIFHPVREAVEISGNDLAPFSGSGPFPAPLYGGPGLIPRDSVETLAVYSGFTEKTVFLVDPELARETLIGRGAIIRKRLGAGAFYLFGPHLEHPQYRTANQWVRETVLFEVPPGVRSTRGSAEPGDELTPPAAVAWLRSLKRELSNARIVVSGLENEEVAWRIGRKLYDPLKLRVFLEALWKRLTRLEKAGRVWLPEGPDKLTEQAAALTVNVRLLKRQLAGRAETTPLAESIFGLLKRLAREFLAVYFRTLKVAVHET